MRIRTFVSSLICFSIVSFSASAAIRPEIGYPLQEALQLAKAHDYKAALARVDAADKVPNKSDEEQQTIFRVRDYLNVVSHDPSLQRHDQRLQP